MDRLQQAMHSVFEAELPHRLRRAARVTLQAAHWSPEGRSISAAALDSAITIVRGDLRFDGLNREHAHEYQRLAARAEECLRHVATVEAEVFAYRVEGERVTPCVPRHWLSGTMKSPQVKLRQLW